ncbi:putative zinc-binding metallopeptidase [Undibacterium luofuense]|uniref:putative zinc-binding metallopeptidase n=1 Tax=Undibacterium luofuense TaxID=2828733 RepID=UPI0030EBDBD4
MDMLINAWLPIEFATNSMNRSLGQMDLYPFVLSPQVIRKLGFIHALTQGAQAARARSNRGQGRRLSGARHPAPA